MAIGKTHDRITIIIAPFVTLFLLLINLIILDHLGDSIVFSSLGVCAYIFGGFMFSGDLDIRSREFNRWGKLKFIWIPYQKIFSHRSIFTHGIILGPAIRLLYVYTIPLVFCSILYSLAVIQASTYDIINNTLDFINNNPLLSLNFILGLVLGSGLHSITDVLYSFFKKLLMPKKKYRRKSSKRKTTRRKAS